VLQKIKTENGIRKVKLIMVRQMFTLELKFALIGGNFTKFTTL